MFANVCFAAGYKNYLNTIESQNYLSNDTHESILGPYVYLKNKLAYDVNVETWVPSAGVINGYLVPHEETFTISDYLTVKDDLGRILYKPTCYFAYKPCDEAMHSVNKFRSYAEAEHLLKAGSFSCMGADITEGVNEVGVLVSLNNGKSYWYGAGLSIDFTRSICKESNGTAFYVAAGLYGALEYIKKHPHEGYLSNEEIDHSFILEYAKPYLENLKGYMIDWSPRSVEQYISQ